jgi:hypothetical protein
MQINKKLVRRLPTDVLQEGAEKLGMFRGGRFVFDNEDQTSVLMDYCIYDVYRKGRNAVDHYLCDHSPDPESDELACLRAMQHTTFALIVVLDVEQGVGCHVRNLFTEETHLLIDMGLSVSAQRGAIIATRLLDYGEYVTTSGAALPLGILPEKELNDWQHKIGTGTHDDRFDPAPLIRECLHLGVSSNIIYAEPGTAHQPDAEDGPSWGEKPAKRKRAGATREERKPAPQRRCRCGSGKMFKNCCGKR